MADRRIIYFLGAGASYGAGARATVQAGGVVTIPTQANFWVTFLRFCKSSGNRKLIESFLFRYFLGYGKKPSRLNGAKRSDLLRKVDVEEVFTFLSERTRAPSTSIQLRTYVQKVWQALAEELGHVFGRFKENSSTRSLYRAFVRNHFRRSDAIVSFNYDTIFEYSLKRGQRWSYNGINPHPSGIPIYKPHGSINWKRGSDGRIVVKDGPGECVVVAPTHLKFISGHEQGSASSGYLDQSKEISEIWSLMEREMRDAAALVFIGYSFPVADLYFASVLRSVLADRDSAPGIVVVNPDSVAIAERIERRFPLAKIVKYFDIHQFAGASRQSILAAVSG